MPIRMTDDDPSESREDEGGGGGRGSFGGWGGGGGGRRGGLDLVFLLLNVIPHLLNLIPFLFRHPKLALVLLLAGGGGFFYLRHTGYLGFLGGSGPVAASLGTGAVLDQKVYDQALVHEPLAAASLPQRASLLEWAPPRLDQGRQGSCVGWATSYAARTILLARQTGQPAESVRFSPSFTYNQVALPGCNGTYLVRALELLQRTGDLPLGQFAYSDQECRRLPSPAEKDSASQYRIAGFTRLTVDADDYRNNAVALKQHLAQGAPVVIGMNVGGSFMKAMEGVRVWHPTEADYQQRGGWGGHAMAVIGFDDTVEGGAFQIMNSWGPTWGENGVAWVRYRDFDHFVKEAYGLYPMGDARAAAGQHIRFGLIDNATKRHIPIARRGTSFRTVSPIRKGTRFKVEVSNTRPIYIYLFGQETDGSSYVLFPYTEKHSPYCGTTGVRVFPRTQSLTADDKGTRDSIAVVISPRELEYKGINSRISARSEASYGERVVRALGAELAQKARVEARDGSVELVVSAGELDRLHAMVIEFDKT